MCVLRLIWSIEAHLFVRSSSSLHLVRIKKWMGLNEDLDHSCVCILTWWCDFLSHAGTPDGHNEGQTQVEPKVRACPGNVTGEYFGISRETSFFKFAQICHDVPAYLSVLDIRVLASEQEQKLLQELLNSLLIEEVDFRKGSADVLLDDRAKFGILKMSMPPTLQLTFHYIN